MRLAVLKPSWGITGGFELVLEHIRRHLVRRGHEVVDLEVPARAARQRVFGIEVDDDLRAEAPELVRYLVLFDDFAGIDAHRVDAVVSTQPPSFATPARRHLSLFYHHARLFYDLADVGLDAGMLTPTEARIGPGIVRSIDQPRLDAVTWFLAGSPTVAGRLRTFSGLSDNVGLFAAAPVIPPSNGEPRAPRRQALCVSRHEFAKRTELFVHAVNELEGIAGLSIGAGGRLGYVQEVARRLLDDPAAGATSRDLWCTPVPWLQPADELTVGDLTFAGFVAAPALQQAYQQSACVVAPALDEDYGLTALEAMANAKPVIACADGGGLTDLVRDGVTGLIVEPDGRSIATAIERARRRPGAGDRDGPGRPPRRSPGSRGRRRSTSSTTVWKRCCRREGRRRRAQPGALRARWRRAPLPGTDRSDQRSNAARRRAHQAPGAGAHAA